MSTAEYRLVARDGAVVDAGSGDVTVTGGVLELQPAAGPALRVPSARIAAVAEPEPFTVLVTLADGTGLELTRLGRMRTQLLEELRDAQAAGAAAEAGSVGDPIRFSGTVGADSADVHVFEDSLLVLAGRGGLSRVAFSFVADVRAAGYTVVISLAGGDQVAVTRLGRRTDEFAALLAERLSASRSRTAAFLGALLPGLDPMALRTAAGLLRDGVAVPAAALDAVHPDLSATLLRVATRPERSAALAALPAGLSRAIGFKQVTSVRRPAVGVTPWHDPAATPHIGDHGMPGSRFGGGFGGLGYGGYGGYGYGGPFGGGPAGFAGAGGLWAFRALGGGPGGNSADVQHQMTQRPDVQRGLLTPETEDLTALTTSGETPTVLAFALLASGGTPVAYEVLNVPEPLTYVYRLGGPDPRAAVNQALDAAGFAPAELHAATSGDLTARPRQDAASSPLTAALVATVPHDASWGPQLARLLAG